MSPCYLHGSANWARAVVLHQRRRLPSQVRFGTEHATGHSDLNLYQSRTRNHIRYPDVHEFTSKMFFSSIITRSASERQLMSQRVPFISNCPVRHARNTLSYQLPFRDKKRCSTWNKYSNYLLLLVTTLFAFLHLHFLLPLASCCQLFRVSTDRLSLLILSIPLCIGLPVGYLSNVSFISLLLSALITCPAHSNPLNRLTISDKRLFWYFTFFSSVFSFFFIGWCISFKILLYWENKCVPM